PVRTAAMNAERLGQSFLVSHLFKASQIDLVNCDADRAAIGPVVSTVVQAAGGDDSLTVSLGNGDLALPGGFYFDGGTGNNTFTIIGAAGNHSLAVTSGVAIFDTDTYQYVNAQRVFVDP